jgi:hypothetical protein
MGRSDKSDYRLHLHRGASTGGQRRSSAMAGSLALLLAVASLAVGAGSAFALSGPSAGGSAAAVVYGTPTAPVPHGVTTKTTTQTTGTGSTTETTTNSGTTTGSTIQPVTTTAANGVASGTGLPFTGYAVMGVVLIGLILFSTGLVIKRTAQSRRD